MIQVCVQVIIKQKSKGDESRLYFHDPLCPRSVTRIHQASFFLRYKKRFTRHEHRPLRNDILSCDIPTHCLRHIPYSSSCEQVSAANSRSYNSPIFLHRFPMRIGWIIENRDVEFWTPRMDRFLFLLHLSGKVFVLSGSMWRSGGGNIWRGNGNHRKSRSRVFARYAIKVRYNARLRDEVRGKFERGIYVQAQFHSIISVEW